MEDLIMQILAYTIPALIMGVIAYYIFGLHFKNEESRRKYLLHRESLKASLPLRLQAYERIALYLERMNPVKLLIRVAPESKDKNEYENLLISHIETEFDHNLAQQIYISDECWNVVKTCKNATIQLIRKAGMNADSPDKLRELILNELLEKRPPSETALSFIKREIGDLLR